MKQRAPNMTHSARFFLKSSTGQRAGEPVTRRGMAAGIATGLSTLFILGTLATPVSAQSAWPNRNLTLVSPFDAGSQPDQLARAFAEGLRETLGKPVVVQNRLGAAGTLAVDSVAKAAADGYTLGFGPPGQFTVQPKLRKNFPYSMADFEFLCQSNATVFVIIAGPKTPFNQFSDLIEAAKRAPGSLNYGSIGHASFPHLIAEWLGSQTGAQFHHVPFKAAGDMVIQLANGTLQFISSTPASATARPDFKPLLQTGEQRLARLPNVPLAREVGLPVPLMGSAVGLYGPKGMPAEVSSALKAACKKVVQHPAVKQASEITGTPIHYRDSAAYTELLLTESREVGVLLEKLGTDAK